MHLVSLTFIQPNIQHLRRRVKGRWLESVNVQIPARGTKATLEKDIEDFRQKGQAWIKEKQAV